MRIYTNTTALTVQRDLSKSRNVVGDAITRLSSGLRINSARDDAAGLAISNRMESRIRGMDVAQKNVKDGNSLLETIDSSLEAISDHVQRIRELAVQKANGTLSPSNQKAIQLEIDQRLEDIDRLGMALNFNGQSLSKTDKTIDLQIGDGVGDSLPLNLRALNQSSLGLQTSAPKIGPPISVENPLVNPPGFTTSSGVLAEGEWYEVSKLEVVKLEQDPVTGVVKQFRVPATEFFGTDDISVHPVLDNNGNYLPNTGVAVKVGNDYYSRFGRSLNFDPDTRTFRFALEMSNGVMSPTHYRTAEVFDVATGVTTQVTFDQQKIGFDTDGNYVDYVTYSDANGREYYLDRSYMTSGMTINSATGENLSPYAVNLKQAEYIDASDEALSNIADYRAYIGAMMNRMDSISNGLANGSTDLRAAQSRIQDADYALEISNLTRGQILQQAGQAVLAQANQIPNGVLSLLQR